mmetsp:Transcript_1844/g.3328  ORF Transcript_1844/g.3328 Transcript_1844/m.3328 type:complete len:226 (-) Transcript_1844:502-1179(-)
MHAGLSGLSVAKIQTFTGSFVRVYCHPFMHAGLSGRSVATCTRSLNSKAFTSLPIATASAAHVDNNTIVANEEIPSTCTWFASVHSVWLQNPTFAEDADSQRAQWLQFTHHAIAALVLALASTALANRKLTKQNWVTAFQDLWVSNSSVRAMRMDSRSTFPCRSCSRSSCNSLVVSKLFVTKSEIVHATLTGRTSRKGFENHINDSLRSQNIATDDTSIRRWVKQ